MLNPSISSPSSSLSSSWSNLSKVSIKPLLWVFWVTPHLLQATHFWGLPQHRTSSPAATFSDLQTIPIFRFSTGLSHVQEITLVYAIFESIFCLPLSPASCIEVLPSDETHAIALLLCCPPWRQHMSGVAGGEITALLLPKLASSFLQSKPESVFICD